MSAAVACRWLPNSASTVRFVNVSGAVNDVDFGMFVPSDYCQPNPLMATGCAIYGDAVAGENSFGYTRFFKNNVHRFGEVLDRVLDLRLVAATVSR